MSLTFMTTQSLLALLLTLTLHRIHHASPSTLHASARAFTRLNSRLYSLFSFLLFLLIATPTRWYLPLHPNLHGDDADRLVRRVFHLSKFYEYVDIWGVVLASGLDAVGLHFAVHHATTPWLTWTRVVGGEAEGWRWFAAANALHHGAMYAWFGGWCVRGGRLREGLIWTGQMQLYIGIAADLVIVRRRWIHNDGEIWRYLVSGGLLATYSVLSLRELRWEKKEKVRGAEWEKEE